MITGSELRLATVTASVHWEVGNALTAALKRRRLTSVQAQRALTAYARIPIRFVEVDLALAVELAADHELYAYDAYLLVCALQHRAPLLTLDADLGRVAEATGVSVVQLDS